MGRVGLGQRLVTDSLKLNHDRGGSGDEVEVGTKLSRLDTAFEDSEKMAVPAVVKPAQDFRQSRIAPGAPKQFAKHYHHHRHLPESVAQVVELQAQFCTWRE